MKKMILFPVLSLTLLAACKNNKPKATSESTFADTTATTTGNSISNEETDKLSKIKEELSKLNPLGNDELKALVPAELMGTPASNVDASSSSGASSVAATYIVNDSMEIRVTIVDCAGPGGMGIFEIQYAAMADANVNVDTDEEYTKTTGFNGGKAFENCKKKKPECTFTCFSGGRFLVTIEGTNMSMEKLKEAAKKLAIK